MIPDTLGVGVWLATGNTDTWRGMNSLALQVRSDVALCQAAGVRPLHLAVAARGCTRR
jgi:hypothetical protein